MQHGSAADPSRSSTADATAEEVAAPWRSSPRWARPAASRRSDRAPPGATRPAAHADAPLRRRRLARQRAAALEVQRLAMLPGRHACGARRTAVLRVWTRLSRSSRRPAAAGSTPRAREPRAALVRRCPLRASSGSRRRTDGSRVPGERRHVGARSTVVLELDTVPQPAQPRPSVRSCIRASSASTSGHGERRSAAIVGHRCGSAPVGSRLARRPAASAGMPEAAPGDCAAPPVLAVGSGSPRTA